MSYNLRQVQFLQYYSSIPDRTAEIVALPVYGICKSIMPALISNIDICISIAGVVVNVSG